MDGYMSAFHLAEVQQLVDQCEQIVGIAVGNFQLFADFRVSSLAQEMLYGADDECQWRAELMGDVCEEGQFVCCKLLYFLRHGEYFRLLPA